MYENMSHHDTHVTFGLLYVVPYIVIFFIVINILFYHDNIALLVKAGELTH